MPGIAGIGFSGFPVSMKTSYLRQGLRYGIMLHAVIYLSFIFLVGCGISKRGMKGFSSSIAETATGSSLYPFSDSLGFTGRDTLWTEFAYNNQVTRIHGKVAIDVAGKARLLRIGPWQEYYANGQVGIDGEYGRGRYIDCCAHGHCAKFYNFKKGPWSFWHPNGQLRAQGTFETQRRHLKNNCTGGDQLLFGVVQVKQWKFWDESGNLINPTTEMIQSIEGVYYQVPGYGIQLHSLARVNRHELSYGIID